MRLHYGKILMTCTMVLALSGFPSPAPGQALTPPAAVPVEFKTGDVIVRFKEGTSRSLSTVMTQRYGATWSRNLYNSDVQVWQVPEGREAAVVDALNADPTVDYAELNYRYHALDTVPDDPKFGLQWAHDIIQSPAAWDYTTGSEAIIIAIIDSGIDPDHPDLEDKLVPGRDFVPATQDDNPRDENGHGTHVAGIAAAATNNTTGIAGMAWDAKLMPVRVLGKDGDGYTIDIANGIRWAYQHGAKILNLSFGGTVESQAMQAAIQEAHDAGALIFAAIGNCRVANGSSCPTANPTYYPAAFEHVVAVAATDWDDAHTSYSQYGPHCDIAAPGGEMTYPGDLRGIYSTMPTYTVTLTSGAYNYPINYAHLKGTSQAVPHVAGLAALIWSLDPDLTADEVWEIIRTTAVDLGAPGKDVDYGHGRINARAAVQAIAPPLAPVLDEIDNADRDGHYIVNWQPSEITDYYILAESGTAAFKSSVQYWVSGTQFTVTAQVPGVWYYRVQASNAHGDSAWSETQSVDVVPTAPLLNPITNPGEQDVYQLTWSLVPGALGYRLQESVTSTFSADVTTRCVGVATVYNVTGQSGGTWHYRVQAYNEVGNGPWSTVQTTYVATAPLPAPVWSGETIHIYDEANFYLTWHAVPSATHYTLEESASPYFVAPTEVYTGTQPVYAAVNHARGTWCFRVRAHGTIGNSPWSTTELVTVTSYVYLPFIMKH